MSDYARVDALTDRISQLEKALVYVGHHLHGTPQYMLCDGVSLIDNDGIIVKADGIDVAVSLGAASPVGDPTAPQMISPDECAQDVYKHGKSVGLFDIPKETANAICSQMTVVTGVHVDWHYIAGRVHIKALAADPADVAPAIELAGVKEVLAADRGFWRTCSGCHESEDGHPVGDYPFSDILQCDLGAGCAECGGIGAVWDSTDYDDMAEFLERREEAEEAAQDMSLLPSERTALIADMVNRFLEWKLPLDFTPDAGITFEPPANHAWWPVGTNLLTANQATQMVQHILPATGGHFMGAGARKQFDELMGENAELREMLAAQADDREGLALCASEQCDLRTAIDAAENLNLFDAARAERLREVIFAAQPGQPEPPTFEAQHLSLKQKGAKVILTLELDGVEGAPRYAVTPINPSVVRPKPKPEPRAEMAGDDRLCVVRYRWLRERAWYVDAAAYALGLRKRRHGDDPLPDADDVEGALDAARAGDES